MNYFELLHGLDYFRYDGITFEINPIFLECFSLLMPLNNVSEIPCDR